MSSPYLIVALAIAALAAVGWVAPGASLLPALLFWAALLQGAIALVAAGELTRARWIAPIRGTLLGLHPLLLVFPFGFAVHALVQGAPAGSPIAWLRPGPWIARNVLLLAATWLLALLLARAVARGEGAASRGATDAGARKGAIGPSSTRSLLAGLYALAFVLTQTLIAFDWVMALEYPWVSTLFGGYFFVEALYAGIVLAVLAAARHARRHGEAGRATLRDASTLLFGFSLLWAGQFFAQYLVIWYGNLPHEVEFLARRLAGSPLRELSTLVLGCLFLVPFAVLLSRSAKVSPRIAPAMGLLVLAGILAERLVFLLPVAPMRGGAATLAFLVLAAAFVLRGRRLLADENGRAGSIAPDRGSGCR